MVGMGGLVGALPRNSEVEEFTLANEASASGSHSKAVCRNFAAEPTKTNKKRIL